MGMSSASSVSLTSLSAAQEIPVIRTITWLLGIREADGVCFNHNTQNYSKPSAQPTRYCPWDRKNWPSYPHEVAAAIEMLSVLLIAVFERSLVFESIDFPGISALAKRN